MLGIGSLVNIRTAQASELRSPEPTCPLCLDFGPHLREVKSGAGQAEEREPEEECERMWSIGGHGAEPWRRAGNGGLKSTDWRNGQADNGTFRKLE